MRQKLTFYCLLAVLATGCSEWRSLRAKVQQALGVNERQESSAESSNNSAMASHSQAFRTKCCWCVQRDTSENLVKLYTGEASCERQSDTNQFRTCRSVEVEGDSCSLVRLHYEGENLACARTALRYEEEGKIKNIESSSATPCEISRLASYSAPPSAAKPNPNSDIYCSCGRDPNKEGNCAAIRVEAGRTSTLESLPRSSSQNACTTQVCLDLFKNKWQSICPNYVPGTP